MKTIWQLTYETIPGNGEQINNYKSFAEAKRDIKKIISQICISPYTEEIRGEGTYKAYRDAMSDFLNNYVSGEDFFTANDPFPSTEADDYVTETESPRNDADEDVDYDEWYDEDEEVDDLDDFDIYIGKDSISFESYHDGNPTLNTNMVVMDDKTEDYYFSFFVEGAPKNSLQELQIKLTPLQDWGTSAYPILILQTLENSRMPIDQQDIIHRIRNDYDTSIERKAVGRNISLLKNLGYDIQHNGAGYYIPMKVSALENADFQALVESINANEKLDDDRKRELIDKLFEM